MTKMNREDVTERGLTVSGGSEKQTELNTPGIAAVLLALFVIVLVSEGSGSIKPEGPVILGVIIVAMIAFVVALRLAAKRYFEGASFLSVKQALADVISEHNDIAAYASSLKGQGVLSLSTSTGQQAHLAMGVNTSRHGYRRDRNVANFEDRTVHNCSLQTVRNAEADPIKYFIKYFVEQTDEKSLECMEALGVTMSRLDSAVENLKEREARLKASVNPPRFITMFFGSRLTRELGVNIPSIDVTYTRYTFEYVSAGGNSSQRTEMELDPSVVDLVIERLSERIRFRESAAGQRALMTSQLRSFIKERDGHTCQYCGVSVTEEPHLLLEVDHIVPVSRGGMTVVENLQTLCWRCNRSKGNKIFYQP